MALRYTGPRDRDTCPLNALQCVPPYHLVHSQCPQPTFHFETILKPFCDRSARSTIFQHTLNTAALAYPTAVTIARSKPRTHQPLAGSTKQSSVISTNITRNCAVGALAQSAECEQPYSFLVNESTHCLWPIAGADMSKTFWHSLVQEFAFLQKQCRKPNSAFYVTSISVQFIDL